MNIRENSLQHNNLLADHLDAISYYENLYRIEKYEFRSSAYTAAASLFRRVKYEVLTKKEVIVFKGVGAKISKRVEEFSKTGTTRKLEKLRARDQERDRYISLFTTIKEVTIADANNLYDYGVRSLEELDNNRSLLTREQSICMNYFSKLNEVISSDEIFRVEELIRSLVPKNVYTIAVGPYRRGEDAKEVDILFTYLGDIPVLMPDILKTLVYVMREGLWMSNTTFRGILNGSRMINARIFPEKSYPHAVFHLTSSDLYRTEARLAAEGYGVSLNEYRMIEGSREIKIPSERILMYALRRDYLPPIDREKMR